MFAPVNVPAGDQLYVIPEDPEATSTVELPLQTLTEGLAVIVGIEMFTETISESEHPLASVT